VGGKDAGGDERAFVWTLIFGSWLDGWCWLSAVSIPALYSGLLDHQKWHRGLARFRASRCYQFLGFAHQLVARSFEERVSLPQRRDSGLVDPETGPTVELKVGE